MRRWGGKKSLEHCRGPRIKDRFSLTSGAPVCACAHCQRQGTPALFFVCFDALTCIKILFQCHTLFNVYFFNVGWPRFCEASPPRFASLGQQKVSTPTQRLLYICANKGGYDSWELKQIWTCCLTWDPVPSVDSFHRQLHGFCVLQLCYLYKPHEAVQVLQPGAEKHRNSGSFDICHHLEMCLACLAV
jgi:hypothetical protein